MDIHVDPPRHVVTGKGMRGEICYRAIIDGDCPLQHTYELDRITRDEEAQLEWIRAQIDGSYLGLDYRGPDTDIDALEEARRMAFAALVALDNRDAYADAEFGDMASGAHGRAIGYAQVARDLIRTFINRATQQGVLDPFTKTSQEG